MSRVRTWTDEELTEAVIYSFCPKEVEAWLGLKGRSQGIRSAIVRLGLDTSHFYNPNIISPKKRTMRRQGNKCSKCGLDPMWEGEILVLQLDHVDGNPANNSDENLRLLCPNCHSQTPTHSRNKNGHGRS